MEIPLFSLFCVLSINCIGVGILHGPSPSLCVACGCVRTQGENLMK